MSEPKDKRIKRLLYSKTRDFQRRSVLAIGGKLSKADITFEFKDVLNKFGDKPKCYITGKSISWEDTDSYHFDHVIPVAYGGENSIENLGLTTKRANQMKGDMTLDELIEMCKLIVANHEKEKH